MYNLQASLFVLSHEVDELDVVNLISGLSLEALVDQSILCVCDIELHTIEDGSESRVANESTLTLVYVLEEGLDQESSISNFSSYSI
jgi:hypothetical protein